MEEELKKISSIIHNKIYNSNIIFYESIAINGEDFSDKVLDLDAISENDIKNSITNNKDLNVIKGINLQDYTGININEFYKHAEMIRSKGLNSYLDYIRKEDTHNCIELLTNIMEYFTEDEVLLLKDTFIRRTIDSRSINMLSKDRIEHLFWLVFNDELKKQELEKDM